MIRFGKLPKTLVKHIKAIDDLLMLKNLHRLAVTSESLAMFANFIPDDEEDELPIFTGGQAIHLVAV